MKFRKYLFNAKRIKKMPVRVSVAMAVYNGEKYLKEQLDSILPQLSCNDEIVHIL